MNKIYVTGRLTRDPEFKIANSGIATCKFSVAVDRQYSKDKETDFFDCVAFRKTAEFVNNYFVKGKPILVSGKMQSRKWVDKNNASRISWEIMVDDCEFFGGEKTEKKSAQATPIQYDNVPDVMPGEFAEIPGGDSGLPWVDDVGGLPL